MSGSFKAQQLQCQRIVLTKIIKPRSGLVYSSVPVSSRAATHSFHRLWTCPWFSRLIESLSGLENTVKNNQINISWSPRCCGPKLRDSISSNLRKGNATNSHRRESGKEQILAKKTKNKTMNWSSKQLPIHPLLIDWSLQLYSSFLPGLKELRRQVRSVIHSRDT